MLLILLRFGEMLGRNDLFLRLGTDLTDIWLLLDLGGASLFEVYWVIDFYSKDSFKGERIGIAFSLSRHGECNKGGAGVMDIE